MFWVASQPEDVIVGCDAGLPCVVTSPEELEGIPTVIYEFDRGVSVFDRDPVSVGILSVVALVPNCGADELRGEVVGSAGGYWDKGVVLGDY